MFEKVNPGHPDKVADRIAGAIVDLAYTIEEDPKVAAEVLIGHCCCHAIIETSADMNPEDVENIIRRVSGEYMILPDVVIVKQDPILARNQEGAIRCGDNGIFKGVPVTDEQAQLSIIARALWEKYESDGKYILDGDRLIVCQSNASAEDLRKDDLLVTYPGVEINPLGDWTGGTCVDCGATNRKLGSDMGDSVTGGGLHGKDLSKADVSVNIYAWLLAQMHHEPVELSCAIGDTEIDGVPYEVIVQTARAFIKNLGGFEKFAEWGLI